MSRDQRAQDNWALLYAQQQALTLKAPLIVIFCLNRTYLTAAAIHYRFMMESLQTVSQVLAEKNIGFALLTGPPSETLPAFIQHHSVSLMVTDFDPLRGKRQWKQSVLARTSVPVFEVDAHNIIPCWHASSHQEYGAYTLRPKINRLMPAFLEPYPILLKHPFGGISLPYTINWSDLVSEYGGTRQLPSTMPAPGEASAKGKLEDFIINGLANYDTHCNDPSLCGQSGLSPYLHFGQLSAQRIALSVFQSGSVKQSQDAFLEELIIRRELADNFCYYNENYDNIRGFPAWAQETLLKHLYDERPYLYDRDSLENANTHDPAWNAAQRQLILTGAMHGYMRMYWAKKILEWSHSPDSAMQTTIYLNDHYSLDGRDANGYAGIAWSLGGVHDRAWSERPVFGKIRYMNYAGLKRKFNIPNYMARNSSLSAASARPS
jgi:deoxyribodipyrimidine photo-lyase